MATPGWRARGTRGPAAPAPCAEAREGGCRARAPGRGDRRGDCVAPARPRGAPVGRLSASRPPPRATDLEAEQRTRKGVVAGGGETTRSGSALIFAQEVEEASSLPAPVRPPSLLPPGSHVPCCSFPVPEVSRRALAQHKAPRWLCRPLQAWPLLTRCQSVTAPVALPRATHFPSTPTPASMGGKPGAQFPSSPPPTPSSWGRETRAGEASEPAPNDFGG